MPRIALFLVLLATPVTASPAAAVRAALADAVRQPKAAVTDYRYLSLYNITPKARGEFLQVLSFHLNSLSRESEVVRPLLVMPDLVRISLLDYGISAATWEKLAAVDPYFHAQLVKTVVAVVEEEEIEVGYWHQRSDGQIVTSTFARENPTAVWWEKTGTQKRTAKKQEAKKQETLTSAAPWLPVPDIAALTVLTGSETPILRADWFVFWTAIQAGRKGAGYYDFLGFKSLKDAEELAGLDRKASIRLRKEIAALVSESGVALNNRQVFRYQTISGDWWETLDSNTSVAEQNALSRFDRGDFKFDATEVYFSLPNALFGLVAANNQGVLQETVPDTIAPNHVSRSNDRRIHPGLSCIECHTGGLQPIDDWSRSVYQGPENPGSPIVLAAVDPKKLKRLRQLYLSPLKIRLKKDVVEYADALILTNGLTPEKNAAAYADQWYRYAYTSLGPDEVALELGVSKEVWLKALKQYVAPNGVPVIADTVLVGMLGGRKVRREHSDERFALMQEILSKGR